MRLKTFHIGPTLRELELRLYEFTRCPNPSFYCLTVGYRRGGRYSAPLLVGHRSLNSDGLCVERQIVREVQEEVMERAYLPPS